MGKRRTLRKDDSSSLMQPDNANLTPVHNKHVSMSSPADWLSSIHHNQNDNMNASPHSPCLDAIAQELRSGHSTPELQIRLQKVDSEDLKAPKCIYSSPDDKDSDDNAGVISPTSGLKTTNFYGTKTKSFQFSFRKAPLDDKKKEVKKKQTRENGKMGSLKRKHKSPKQAYTKNCTVKRSKKDDVISDEINKTNNCEETFTNDIRNNECVDNLNEHCGPSGTILDVITPESSSSSSEIEDLTTITKPNGIIKECNGTDNTEKVSPIIIKENHILKSYSKAVIEDVISEFGSLHSEDSLASGIGSIKSSTLVKGQNGEYYFSNSNESSPNLTINGHSRFFETPKNSSLSSSPESEVSSTANSDRTILLFSDVKESDGSSYSPSINGCHSSNSVSPECQTSITSFFKRSSKQGNELGSPKTKKQNRLQRTNNNKKKEQMYLDLGQRNFGHVTCTTCGMVYTHAQPDDEIEHIRHHKKFVNGLRFKGWKDEHVVKEFSDGRIIMVKPDDHPSHQKKAEEIRKVVDSELGFAVDLPYRKNESKTFLFIANKRVVGCCVATQINKGYPVLPSTPTKDSTPDRQIAAWCCSTVPVPAQCGISKIWVWNQYRRKKVATRLIESVRTHFIYGCIIAKDVLAFSDPTPDGKRLATAYIGIPEFLVFH